MKGYYRDKVILITGASAGIGLALGREAAALGARVVLTARRLDRLAALERELGRDRALGVQCDVTADGELERAVEAAHAFGTIDVLVANAGFGVDGAFSELTLDDYRRQFETNVFGVIRSIRAALPDLRRTRGVIGIMGSANGLLAFPGWSAYCMSKFAVRALAESLGPELHREGIGVTYLAPGFIATEFRRVDRDGVYRAARADPVPAWLQMTPERAARQMLRALARRRREAVITTHAKLGAALSRGAPGLTAAVMRRMGPWLQRASEK
ncbi:MAG: SDR family NAD(P)-dependent oxidoreductase [Polyangiaceae bacterium]|nr:SDR family NAD(P)-dependent oxidoreductase [Polyangiaceae bacterium]